MPSRFLHLQNLRQRNAADALVAARESLRGQVDPRNPKVPRLYVLSILSAGDEFGEHEGLVVQGDGVGWLQVEALYDLAHLGIRAHRAETGHGGGESCDACRQGQAAWSVSVAGRIRERRR